MSEQGRWAGPNLGKDIIRHEIWAALERDGVNVGPAARRRDRMLARRQA